MGKALIPPPHNILPRLLMLLFNRACGSSKTVQDPEGKVSGSDAF